MAVATPAMFPVPINAASAVMNAWNGVSAPSLPLPRRTNATPHASTNRLTWTNPVRIVRNAPAPRSTTTTHGMKRPSARDWMREATDGLYQARGSALQARSEDRGRQDHRCHGFSIVGSHCCRRSGVQLPVKEMPVDNDDALVGRVLSRREIVRWLAAGGLAAGVAPALALKAAGESFAGGGAIAAPVWLPACVVQPEM